MSLNWDHLYIFKRLTSTSPPLLPFSDSEVIKKKLELEMMRRKTLLLIVCHDLQVNKFEKRKDSPLVFAFSFSTFYFGFGLIYL